MKDLKELRNQFLPKQPNLVFVLESPPLNHGFVYDPDGRVSEVLFRAFMKLLRFEPINKWDGLRALQNRGWVLTNVIYQPVNKMNDRDADKLIRDNIPIFLDDLDKVCGGSKSVPIVLIKKNICNIFEPVLEKNGYNVLNNGVMIPFPLHYHADRFHNTVCRLLWSKETRLTSQT